MGGDGLPGPTDAWVTLAALARETSRIRLGTLVSSATFRWPGVLAITVAQVDAMSGGRVELGLGTGWYDGEHTAYGIPFPAAGRAFRAPRGAAGDPHRDCGRRRSARSSPIAGTHYHVGGQPGPAEAAPATPSAAHPGRRRGQAHAPARGRLRRRVQRALSRGGRYAGPVHPGARGLRAARPRPGQPRALGGPGRLLRRRRGRSGRAGPGPSAGRSTSCAPTAPRARPTRWWPACASLGAAGAGTVYLQVLDLDDLDHLRLLSERVLPHLG